MFGEGASTVAIPESTRASGRDQPGVADAREQDNALTPEQFQRKAQSRGLWDGGANNAPSQPTQPRAGTLPRAVVGTASPGVANTNFQNPSIGNEVSPPLPATLAAAQPVAAGKASLEAAAALNQASKQQRELDLGLAETEDVRTGKPVIRARDARAETDPDAMDTMELDMAKFIQKAGPAAAEAIQKARDASQTAQNAQARKGAPAAKPAPVAATAPAARAPQTAPEQPQPTAATPPTVAAQAARAEADQTAKPGTITEKLATRPTPSGANSAVLLALIVIAALIALLFIGAALGIWRLPWAAAAGHASLSKTMSAKSLPEMRTPAVPAAPRQQVIATSTAAPAAPAHAEDLEEPAAVGGDAVAVMAADEAAPLHAAASSGGDPEDEADRPALDVAEVLSNARAELRAGHIKEAEALLRPELEKNPSDHHVAEVLAQTLMARGAAVEAVALAQKIVKTRPKRASYRVLLGDALRRAGDEPGAKAAYREALALDPNLRDAHARLEKLN